MLICWKIDISLLVLAIFSVSLCVFLHDKSTINHLFVIYFIVIYVNCSGRQLLKFLIHSQFT